MTAGPPTLSIRQWQRLENVYAEYPRQFWILVAGTFIDRLGGALLFPFFTLYPRQLNRDGEHIEIAIEK